MSDDFTPRAVRERAESEWRDQVLSWADEAPSGTAGLDLLRQIVSTPPADAALAVVADVDETKEES